MRGLRNRIKYSRLVSWTRWHWRYKVVHTYWRATDPILRPWRIARRVEESFLDLYVEIQNVRREIEFADEESWREHREMEDRLANVETDIEVLQDKLGIDPWEVPERAELEHVTVPR